MPQTGEIQLKQIARSNCLSTTTFIDSEVTELGKLTNKTAASANNERKQEPGESCFQKISLAAFAKTNPMGRQETSPVGSSLRNWILSMCPWREHSQVQSISCPEALCTESSYRLLKEVGDRRLWKMKHYKCFQGSFPSTKRVVSGARDHRGGNGKVFESSRSCSLNRCPHTTLPCAVATSQSWLSKFKFEFVRRK